MPTEPQIMSIAHVIQLAVAPVFLLTGIGAMLSVLTSRLARIVDRGRYLEGLLASIDEGESTCAAIDLAILSRRARLINWAISLSTTCALLICSVIVVLFVGAFFGPDISIPIALLFVAAMSLLISALIIFLREIHLATASLRFGR
ncbi:MAG: DUF2721 domain-containing protein [Burkholderiales bacterium]|nr:DUF2721 domain-containing protein [Burkholderiales bacterium]